jgi:hypothetical protein
MKSLLILCFFFLSFQAKSQEAPATSQASVAVSMQLKGWSLIEKSETQAKVNIRSSKQWIFKTDLVSFSTSEILPFPLVRSLSKDYLSKTPVVYCTVSPE